jgi:hypothetical protein
LVDGKVVICFGSRSQKLGTDDFFKYKQTMKPEMISKLKTFMETEKIETLNVYGEVFGHQKQIKYFKSGNDSGFKCFDVLINGKLQTWDFVKSFCAKIGLPIVEEFFRGNFEECITYDFSTKRTAVDDIIEGIVIKPLDHLEYGTQSHSHFIKLKHPVYETRCFGMAKDLGEFKSVLTKKMEFINNACTKQPFPHKTVAISFILDEAIREGLVQKIDNEDRQFVAHIVKEKIRDGTIILEKK